MRCSQFTDESWLQSTFNVVDTWSKEMKRAKWWKVGEMKMGERWWVERAKKERWGEGREEEREDHKGWGTGQPRTFPLKATLQVTFTISYYPIIHLCPSLSSKRSSSTILHSDTALESGKLGTVISIWIDLFLDRGEKATRGLICEMDFSVYITFAIYLPRYAYISECLYSDKMI